MKKRSEQWSLLLVLVHGLLATFLSVACGQVVSVGEPERVGEVAEALTDRALLEVSPARAAIPATVQQQFEATVLVPGRPPKTPSEGVTWSVSDPSVASVDTNGLVTALVPGSASISAAYFGLTATATLTVTPATLVSMTVHPAQRKIHVGTHATFVAEGTFSDGNVFSLIGAVSWTSSDTTLATVDSTGRATGIAAGVVSITATDLATQQTATAFLTVGRASLESVTITPTDPSVPNGLTVSFTATGTFSDGSTQDVSDAVIWSSSNTAVATMSNASGSEGVATAASLGTTTIQAIFGGTMATTTLTVTSAVLVSIAVTPSTVYLSTGASVSFTAIGTYSDGTTQNITASVTWSSSGGTAVSISNAAGSNGVATGLSVTPGAILILATDPSTGIQGEASVTVVVPPPSCLVAGTYTIPSTVTTCSCGTTATTTGVDVEFQIVPPGGLVDYPTAGWLVVWIGPAISPPGNPTGSSPIVSTASGFSSSVLSGVSCPGFAAGEETLNLAVDCETGIATLSASCVVGNPNLCPEGAGPTNCGPFGVTNGTSGYSSGITGSCTACVGPTLEDASTSDDGSADALSTPDTQAEAESDVTVVSDAGEAGTQDSGVQGDGGAPDATIDATTADGALSDVNAPTDATADGVVTDAQNVDTGVPSCLVPGTYALPVTGTTCNVGLESCIQEMGSTSFDLTVTIVDDPVAGWETTFVGNFSFIGTLTPLPIVFTASGFAVNDTFLELGGSDEAAEELSLSVDCLTGIATFSGTYDSDLPNFCLPAACNEGFVTYNVLSGTCSNCL